VNLALVEVERGNFARARQLFQRAERSNPDVAEPLHGLGVLAERERRPDRASEHYRAALKVDPGFAAARANLGRILFESGRLEEARIQFQRLTEVAPAAPAGYVGLAEALLRLGRVEESERVTEAARTRFRNHPALELLAARSLLRRGRTIEAMELLLPLTRRRDEFTAAALSWLATAELSRGRPRFAVGAAEKALALEPEQPVATRILAEALSQLRDPSAAAWSDRAERLTGP
jgi:tetratricopeptide (TPR) repeat protein